MVQLGRVTLERDAGTDRLELHPPLLTGDILFDASGVSVLATLDGASIGGVAEFERYNLWAGDAR